MTRHSPALEKHTPEEGGSPHVCHPMPSQGQAASPAGRARRPRGDGHGEPMFATSLRPVLIPKPPQLSWKWVMKEVGGVPRGANLAPTCPGQLRQCPPHPAIPCDPPWWDEKPSPRQPPGPEFLAPCGPSGCQPNGTAWPGSRSSRGHVSWSQLEFPPKFHFHDGR